MAQTPTPATDPLFTRPVLLDSARHAELRYNPRAGFRFAAKLTVTPITFAEFPLAARDYPIVFAGPQATPAAVLGLRNGQNLMVDGNGQWRAGYYVPANLQRYPFLFIEDNEKSQFILGADEAAEHFLPAEGSEALFADGEPTALVNRAADFLSRLQGDHLSTLAFSKGLQDTNLLIERRADIQLKDGQHLTLDKFRIVDEAAFNALPEATIVDWHKKTWLPLVYFHLQSLSNWSRLVDLASD